MPNQWNEFNACVFFNILNVCNSIGPGTANEFKACFNELMSHGVTPVALRGALLETLQQSMESVSVWFRVRLESIAKIINNMLPVFI